MSTNNAEQRQRSDVQPAALSREEPARPAPLPAEKEEPKESKGPSPDNLPLFWRMCSAALVSITAMVAVTLYLQLSNNLATMRGEVRALAEDHVGLVRKDDYGTRNIAVAATIKETQVRYEESEKRAARLEKELREAREEARGRNREAEERWQQRHEKLEKDHQLRQERLEKEIQQMRERLAVLEAASRKTGNPD